MGRFTRVVAVDVPHHVTPRGNGRRFVLDGDADRTIYLNLLRENIVLYGVALIQTLQRQNPKTKLSVAPVKVDGIWCLELSYQGDEPAGVPDPWHGHRVILHKLEPPPSA